MNTNLFDVIVVGGGHAGLEAAWISSRFENIKVGLVTLPGVGIASAPCNPAVGGVGKGQVVREIDALGGIMGRLADLAGIQYRVLNESKGYAVRSTRVQIDKEKYSEHAERIVAEDGRINVIRGRLVAVEKADELYRIGLEDGSSIETKKIIVTTGTFLAGLLHEGPKQTIGGRVDCVNSLGLSEIFGGATLFGKKRFKTGTPPRILNTSIDFSKLIEQSSDETANNFHFANSSTKERLSKQVSCYLSHTNEETLGIIRDNKEKSPMFNGQIKGVGPRYCPSIEDKAFRYLDRNTHHVFLEPEGLGLDTFYPSGISTSLPREVQLAFLRTIEGLENAEIKVYGYAVEYDVVETTELKLTLEHKKCPNIYFAGQVNGTSGYEEAAGQGFVAGANAALSILGKKPLILSREDSYIGVMIEDLVTNERDEPYRLFTARSENRLSIREDNTHLRMSPYRRDFGLNDELDRFQNDFEQEFNHLYDLVGSFKINSNKENVELFKVKGYGTLENNITFPELIKRPQLDPIKVLSSELIDRKLSFSPQVVETVAIAIKYQGYVVRAENENEKWKKLDHKKLMVDKLLESHNISFECKQRISRIRPETFGQLQRMEGIRPATLAYVAGQL